MTKNYEERLGTAPMLPLILKMALPGFAAQLINLLYGIVDRMFIGNIPDIGTDALAGVGVTSSVVMLIAAFAQIVGGGGAPLAAMALGRNERERAEKILANGFMLLCLFAAVLMLGVYPFMKPLLMLVGASENTVGYACDYLGIYLAGTFFVMMYTGLSGFINAQGRPLIATLAVCTGAVLNIGLDALFILVFDMGVKGAAKATVISQAASAAIVLFYLLSKNAALKLRLSRIKPDGKIIASLFSLGIAPFVMASTESLVGFVLNGSLKGYRDIYVSALAVMQSAMQFAAVPFGGFAQGIVPIVSYNYGRGNEERIRKCFKYTLAIIFTAFCAINLSMMAFPKFVASLFTSDTVLIEKVGELMPIFLAGMTIFGLQRVCQNMFVSLGQAKISLFIALLRKVILLVPLALILPNFFGVNGVFIAESVADATSAICCTVIFMISFPKIMKAMRQNVT